MTLKELISSLQELEIKAGRELEAFVVVPDNQGTQFVNDIATVEIEYAADPVNRLVHAVFIRS